MLIPNVDIEKFENSDLSHAGGTRKIRNVITYALQEGVGLYLSVLSALIYRIGKKMIQGYIKSRIVDTEISARL